MRYIVDLRECIQQYSAYAQIHEMYRYYPLKEIISNILSPTINYKEMIWYEVESRMNPDLDQLDFDALDIFFELLAEELDRYLVTMIPTFDHSEFEVLAWIDHTTILLREL